MLHRLMMMGGGVALPDDPGAQFSTDFGEYDIGTPDNWTFHSQGGVTSHHITDSNGLISDRCLRFTHTNNSGTWFGFGATWDDLPDAADVEILMLARRDTLNWLGNFWGGAGRISGADSTLAGLFGGTANNDSDARFARLASGWSFTAVDSVAHGGAFGAPGNFWFRFRLDGTSYSLKAWPATGAADRGLSDEPGSWLLTGTDGTITAAGKIGFLMRAQASSSGRIELHYFGVGIDGAVAPGPVF